MILGKNKKRETLLILLVVLTCLGGCSTPLKDYVPSSEKEAEIKNLLLTYEDCWNRRNTECIGGLFTEDARIMIPGRGRKRVLSRNRVPDDLFPMFFDKYGTAKYMIAKIEITENTAHAIVYIDFSRMPLIVPEVHLFLAFHKGKWVIKGQFHEDHFSEAVPRYTFF